MPIMEGRKGWESVDRTWISQRARRSASSLACMEVLSTTLRAKRLLLLLLVVGWRMRKTVPIAPLPRILRALRLLRSSSNNGGAESIFVLMEGKERNEGGRIRKKYGFVGWYMVFYSFFFLLGFAFLCFFLLYLFKDISILFFYEFLTIQYQQFY